MSLKLAESLHTSTHDRTKISQENRKIEKRLEKQLNEVTALARKVYGKTGGQTINTIRTLLDREVAEILKANIQASYQLGIAYVSRLLKREAFMTINDIMACDTLVFDYQNRFWGRISLALSIVLRGETEREDGFVSNKVVTSMASDITVKALNLATALKTKELVGFRQLRQGRITRILNPAPFVVGGIKDIEERIFEDNPGLFPTGGEPPFQKLVLVWVITQDDRTCEQCLDLEGSEYDINDFNIPTPGHESTHWNCRCRLMLAETELE